MYGKKRLAKVSAKNKARAVYRNNKGLPKKAVVKKFANFVGKSTYKAVLAKGKRKRYTKRHYKKW